MTGIQIPAYIYVIVGFLVISNVGTIITGLISYTRVIWYFSQLDARVKQNKNDNDQAHKKIRELESYSQATRRIIYEYREET